LVEASSVAARGGWARPSPAHGALYLPPQLGYLLQSLAVLGVTLLPYSASKDRQQGQPACHGAAWSSGRSIERMECAGRSGSICGLQH
jgi:hypothetical protein